MVFFKQTRTFLCHFDSNEVTETFDITSFMELFIDDGPFSSISDNSFGMAQIDHKEKIYSITFKADDASKGVIKKMLTKYSQRQLIAPKIDLTTTTKTLWYWRKMARTKQTARK